jgi:transcriptional/translational regulatory protein YebC/TACO1
VAGHSKKWANIKHKIVANDKKRAKVWIKIIINADIPNKVLSALDASA